MNTTMTTKALTFAFASLILPWAAPDAVAATAIHSYEFNGSLADSIADVALVGNGKHHLVPNYQ
ncbi:MAG: hypothetical protein ACKN9T_17675, partial [Candidatus Methylumidiphilus sp.]